MSPLKPVKLCTVDELFQELVADAVALRATPLDRYLAACVKIGKEWKIGAEGAHVRVVEEKAALTGNSLMPLS